MVLEDFQLFVIIVLYIFKVTQPRTFAEIDDLDNVVEQLFQLEPSERKMSYCLFSSYHFVTLSTTQLSQENLSGFNQDLLRWVSEDITADGLNIHLKQVKDSFFF